MKNIKAIFYIDPLILIDQQLAEFYDKIANQLYSIINPNYDQEAEENKLLSTVVEVKLLEEVTLLPCIITYSLQLFSYPSVKTGASASSGT